MGIDFNDSLIQLFSSILLVGLIVISYLVVRSDISTQRIPNGLIVRALITGVVLHLVLLYFAVSTKNQSAVSYVRVAALNFIFSLLAGYGLWYFDMWSAGDGKLFPVVALYFPMKFYVWQFVPYFPSVIILVNIYIIAFLAVTLFSAGIGLMKMAAFIRGGGLTAGAVRGFLSAAGRKAADREFMLGFLGMLLYFVSIILVIRGVVDAAREHFHVPVPAMVLATFAVMYAAGNRLRELLKITSVLILSWVVFLCVVVFHTFVLHENLAARIITALLGSFFMMVFMPLARIVINAYQEATERVTVGRLKPGAMLRGESAIRLNVEWGLKDIPAGEFLTDGQVAAIREKCPPEIELKKFAHVVFSPFIMAGTLFTLIFCRSIIHFLH